MPETHLKQLSTLKKRAKQIYKRNKDIIFDIILFGSAVKEKSKPKDIDICIVFSKRIKRGEINKTLSIFSEFHVEYLFLAEIYSEPLWLTLFQEGFSLLRNKFLFEIFNLKSLVLFNYNLKNMDKVRKSKFSHALFGRKEDGLLFKAGGKVFGRGCIAVPVSKSELIREVLDLWKVDYILKRIFVQ